MGCGVVGGSESVGSSVGPGGDDGGCGAAAATDAVGAAATGVGGLTRVSATLTSGSAPRTRPTMWSPSTLKSAVKRRELSSWRMTTLTPHMSYRKREPVIPASFSYARIATATP